MKNQIFGSAINVKNAMKIPTKRGERKRGLPPASPPVGEEEREMEEGENRVRESVEREKEMC